LRFNYFGENIDIPYVVLEESNSDQLQIPEKEDNWIKTQEQYINFANNNVVGEEQIDDLKSVTKRRLRNLASLYYTGMPFIYDRTSIYNLNVSEYFNRLTSENYFKSETVISGENQPFGEVFARKIVINGKIEKIVTNDYYWNYRENDVFINDLSANLNKTLENHIKVSLKGWNIKGGTIIIRRNEDCQIIAEAAYPFDQDNPYTRIAFQIGSIKKAVLAYCALKIDSDYENYKYNNLTFYQWIKTSDNDFTCDILKGILGSDRNYRKFEKVLVEDLNMCFYSSGSDCRYSHLTRENLVNSGDDMVMDVGRGFIEYYTADEVNRWFCIIANDAFNGNNALRLAFNTTFEQGGTAYMVGKELERNSLNPDGFIAKTGTVQEYQKENNLSSSFAICNNEYTITLTLDGKQPNNKHGKTAKYLFNKLIPLLIEYDVL